MPVTPQEADGWKEEASWTPSRPGRDGNTESAVTVSKEDPASPQFDLNRQDAKIKNQR